MDFKAPDEHMNGESCIMNAHPNTRTTDWAVLCITVWCASGLVLSALDVVCCLPFVRVELPRARMKGMSFADRLVCAKFYSSAVCSSRISDRISVVLVNLAGSGLSRFSFVVLLHLIRNEMTCLREYFNASLVACSLALC